MASRRALKWQKQVSRKNLLETCPFCVFCGGMQPATTQEHCPPRHFFKDKKSPQGFVFSACSRCNKGSSDHDQIFSVFAGVRLVPADPCWGDKVDKLKRHMGSKWDQLENEMMIDSREKYFMAMRYGKSCLEELIGHYKVLRLPRLVIDSCRTVAVKLVKGIYYKETGRIFPADGAVGVQVYPNYEIMFRENKFLEEVATRLPSVSPYVHAQGADISDQFKLRFTITDDNNMMNLIATFCDSLTICAFAFSDASLIRENKLENLFGDQIS